MRLEGFVEKGWGHELIWATNDKYCGKLLKFNKDKKAIEKMNLMFMIL